MSKFTCDKCGNQFDAVVDEVQQAKEFYENFPQHATKETRVDVFCDQCFEQWKKENRPASN